MTGSIEIVCGPMFSGKTEELIRRVRRAQIARQKVQIFRPAIDDRYHKTNIVSHSKQSLESTVVSSSSEILYRLYDSTRIVAIDEVQFFDDLIIKVVSKLARRGHRVIMAGLYQDSNGVPFGPVPTLLAIADKVDKVQAICTICGKPATKTFRKDVECQDKILVGENNFYEARCREHYDYHDEEELNDMKLFYSHMKPKLEEEDGQSIQQL